MISDGSFGQAPSSVRRQPVDAARRASASSTAAVLLTAQQLSDRCCAATQLYADLAAVGATAPSSSTAPRPATAASIAARPPLRRSVAAARRKWLPRALGRSENFRHRCCATTSCPGARFSGIHGLRSPRRLVDRCAQLRSRPPSHLPSSTLLRRQLRLRRSAAQPVAQYATAAPTRDENGYCADW